MAADRADGAHWQARAKELEAVRWSLERRVFHLETLGAIAREAGGCHDVAAAAHSVLSVLSGTFGTVSGAVLLYDEDDEIWGIGAVRGAREELPDLGDLDGLGLCTWVETHPQPACPPDLAGSGLEALAEALGGVQVAAPFLHLGRAMGLILLGQPISGEGFSGEDLDLCGDAASTAARLCGDILSTRRYLHQQQQRFRIRGIFEQYCAPEVVERLLTETEELRIAVEHKVVTVLMADIRGFTWMVQQTPPEEMTELINAFFTATNDVVFSHRGTVDKFMGDAVMAVFGDPISYADDAMRGVECAMAMQHSFAELSQRWATPEAPLGLGVGITTGSTLCGIFGSARRFEYTVMGPPVNLAARLSGITRSGEIFLDTQTYQAVCDHVTAHALTPLVIKGIADPVPVFRVKA